MENSQNPNHIIDQESIDTTFRRLNARADILYRFVLLYSDYMNRTHDYSSNESMSMTEAHLLSAIDEASGITVTELAALWNRTKGAISQTVSRLEKKGLIVKEQRDGNRKTTYLLTTPKGHQISRSHKIYDINDITLTMQLLLEVCEPEEIDHFYKVLNAYIQLLKNPQ